MSKVQVDHDLKRFISEEKVSETSLERSCTENSVSSQNTSEINVSSQTLSEKDDESGSDAYSNEQPYTALVRTKSYAPVRKESFKKLESGKDVDSVTHRSVLNRVFSNHEITKARAS